MKSHNFNEREINDFIEYWIPRLTDDNYYNIYPQSSDRIEQVIQLKISVEPDSKHRLFYVISGTDEYEELPEAEIEKFIREGFTVVEWGVVLK